VTTFGDNAYGAKLQSLGGAGGNGGIDVTGSVSVSIENNAAGSIGVGIGGFGGSGGGAGGVTGTVTGTYNTGGTGAAGGWMPGRAMWTRCPRCSWSSSSSCWSSSWRRGS
jgi:hypothetical protein